MSERECCEASWVTLLYDRWPLRLGRCTHKMYTCPEQVGIVMFALCNVDVEVDVVVDEGGRLADKGDDELQSIFAHAVQLFRVRR